MVFYEAAAFRESAAETERGKTTRGGERRDGGAREIQEMGGDWADASARSEERGGK